MVNNSFETKKKARQHIVNAMKVVQYMNPEEAGDYPERQREYKLEIRKAKQLLRKVYSPNNVIFDELDLNTHIGLMAALGTLNIGDEPFIDYKRDAKAVETFNAETFNADSKEEARLKKYEKTYGKEGAKVRNRIFKRIIAKADWGTKANQWSARKAQALTDEYEEAMKGKGKKAYKTSKRTKTQKSLKKWGDQKWKTKSGQDSSKTGERYLPEKAIKALTDKEYKKTSDKKRQDTKKGKQFSNQPKGVAKKVAKYRSETFEAEDNTFNWGNTGLVEHFGFVQFIPKRVRQMPTHVIYRANPTDFETGMQKKTMCGIYLKGKIPTSMWVGPIIYPYTPNTSREVVKNAMKS